MSPEEFKERMILIIYSGKTADDTELRHVAMDNLMCEALINLGYEAGVELFKSTSRWYA